MGWAGMHLGLNISQRRIQPLVSDPRLDIDGKQEESILIRTWHIPVIAAGLMASFSASAQTTPPADAWQIGPVIKGRNYSVGMPLTPAPERGGGWSFDFPYPTVDDGHVHYLTFRHGSLAGKSKIVMRYRIDADRGVRFLARDAAPGTPATMTVYFQRGGDRWTAKGPYVNFRWYAHFATTPLTPGVRELTIDLNDPRWIAVVGGNAAERPEAFSNAKFNADRVGFVMGGGGGLGHGVYTTGPARFTLLSYRVI